MTKPQNQFLVQKQWNSIRYGKHTFFLFQNRIKALILMKMKVTVIWSLISIQEILLHVTVFANDENSSSRSAYIETQENMRLRGHVVQRFKSPSFMSCSHLCLKNAWCTSTNFHWTTCELNKHEVSSINDDTKLYSREGFTFSLFLKVTIFSTFYI